MNYSDLLDSLISHIQVCMCCGSGGGRFSIGLCQHCFKILCANSREGWTSGYKFKTNSLFEWNDNNRKIVIPAVRKLKGHQKPRALRWYAEKLIQKRMANLESSCFWSKKIIFVPAPSSMTRVDDHASCLARSLNEMIGSEVLNVLIRLKSAPQKQNAVRGRWEDVEKRMKLNPKFSFDEENCLIVFVDDLITTGATATAAFIALGRPKNYEVWTIFNRPRLRPFGGFDITHHE